MLDFLKNFFGAGQMARTPSFVPESVGKEIGAKMGGVVPKLSKPAPIPTESGIDPGPLTPKRMGGMVFEPSTAPVETAQAMPNPAINPIPRESILGIRHPNKMVDQVRQNAMYDPVERERFDFLTRGDNPAGDLHGKARLINALQSALAGAAGGYQATGDIGGLIGGAGAGLAGGAISPMGGRNLQFEVSQRPQAEQRMAREMAMRRAQREQQVADTKMQHDQAMVEIARQNAGLAREEQDRKNSLGQPVGAGGLYVPGVGVIGQRTAEPKPTPVKTIGGVEHEWDGKQWTPMKGADGAPLRGGNASGEPSLSDLIKLSELEAAANFDAGTAIQQFREGVRPQVYKQFGITPEMAAMANNPQADQAGLYNDVTKEAIRRVQAAEEELNKQAQLFAKKQEGTYAAQGARKRLGQTKKYGSGGNNAGGNKSSVNLYQYTPQRYGFQD